MPSPEPALEVREVVAGYGRAEVLRGVSLEVRAGEVVGLVGPNGSGKTTIVRAASRAVRPSSGQILVQGRDVHALPGRTAARLVSVVPQDLAAVFPFTVLEMVLMGRSPYRRPWGRGSADDWARVRAAMEVAHVQHLADRPIGELSGGERQRVVLAQALAQDAPVLLLDEPTTHLDVRHVVDLLDIVRGLAVREGTAVLGVFHDLNLAAAAVDRLYVLLDGRVVAQGPAESVLTSALLREVYGVEAEVHPDAVSGRPTVSLHRPVPTAAPLPGRPRAHVIGGAGRAGPLLRSLAERGFDVSVGVLHASDGDEQLAARLNLLRITVPAFSEIDPESEEECLALAAEATVVVLCDAPYGPGNLANLRIALTAAERGVRVVVLEQVPVADRDFTGGEATD
ncbi:MAG: ABC transporter ATP-binding protein, partial [Actinobacteria bacterium]|nr:ABC transporter ATP-binding protein [Actinomycetota bacterium]